MKILLLSLLIITAINNTYGQLAIKGGANYCIERSDYIQNTRSIVTSFMSLSLRYYPFNNIKNLSLQNELFFTKRGYDQDLNSTYKLRINYLSFQLLGNYLFKDFVSLNAGVEFNRYVSSSVKRGYKTYNKWDIGLVTGLDFFENKQISPYIKVIYGLLPAFDYYHIDELGNFTGEFEDLRFTNISVGLKVKLYNEKILIYR